MRILMVEDELAYVDALTIGLEAEGFDVVAAPDGRAGLRLFREEHFDVVLLDLMLPLVSGLDVLRTIREVSQVPVLVVSAKDSEADVVTALELGADDYLKKPYSIRELVARVRAVARRGSGIEDTDSWHEGVVELDADRHVLTVGSEEFDLPRKEFEIMAMLAQRMGRIVTRDRILDEVWGMTWGETKSLDQHIRRLRRKLEHHEAAPRITTLRGVGYRLDRSTKPDSTSS